MDAFKALFADVPALDTVYIHALISVGKEDDVDVLQLCRKVGINETLLFSHDGAVSINQMLSLMEEAALRFKRDDWSLRFGLACGLQTHSMMALPLFHREDPFAVAQLALANLSLRLPFVVMTPRIEHRDLLIDMHEHWPLGKARSHIIDLYVGTLARFVSQMGKRLTACLDSDQPALAQRYKLLGDCQVKIRHPGNQLIVHGFADGNFLPVSPRGRTSTQHNTQNQQMLLLIRRAVILEPGRSCTIERVAEKLGTTPRTLSRYLKAADQSFTEMRNDVRAQHAERYLRDSSLPIASIAERLGYSDQASFSKAFRSWTGQSPGDFRRSGRRTGE